MESSVTAEIPSIDLLEKIMEDDVYFYEFSNNREENIYGFNFKEIQNYLKEFIINYLNNNSNISQKFKERAKYFNDKFSLNIPHFRKINDGLNEDFYNYIMMGVKDLNTPLMQARAIYINLASFLCYDEHAPAYNQNLSNPIMQNIYYTNSSEVTIKNNKVICYQWAIIYAEFLNRIGISAKVIGDGKHKLVEFTIEGKTYTADATNSFLDNDNIYLNDFARVKLNSPTLGFSGASKFDDQQIGFYPKPLIEQYHEFSDNHASLSSMRLTTGNSETDLIVAKLDYLSTMAYHLPLIEAVGYLKQMIRVPNSIITQEEINKLMPAFIRLKDENDLIFTSLVIAIKNGEEYIYKLLNVPEGLITVEKSYFDNLIATGQMIDDGNIPGIGKLQR